MHPRCRCAIIYDEVEKPRGKPSAPTKPPRGLAAGNIDIATAEGSPPKLIGNLEKVTTTTIQKTLEYYESQIVKSSAEHAVIITTIGEIWHCSGDIHGIPMRYFEQMRRELEGAHVTHNHPPAAKENEHTFSDDDFNNFKNFKMARLRGVEERFLYELNQNLEDNELAGYSLPEIYNLGFDFSDYHYAIMLKALSNGLGYWRVKR